MSRPVEKAISSAAIVLFFVNIKQIVDNSQDDIQGLKPGTNLPVIYYVYGSQFQHGSPSRYGPEYMLSRNIILIMVSYRLGVLGFLSTGDSVISGNMALKDQVLALKWTKKNVYTFGGDPNRVTLHGSSAGAMCVHLHTLSPLSKGYFNRVILQSGLGIAPQAFNTKDVSKRLSTLYAREVNCTSQSTFDLLQCLLAKDVEILVRAATKLEVLPIGPGAIFKPTVEDSHADSPFLTENPITASYSSPNLPWLLGMTTAEGAFDVSDFFVDSRKRKAITTTSPILSLPIMTSFLWTAKPSHTDFIAQTIETHFFGDEEIGPTTDDALVEVLTGVHFGMSLLSVLQKYEGLKYAYLYDYKGNWTSQDSRYGKYLGVSHGDETGLLFKQKGKFYTNEDYAFGDELLQRFINFAYSGNPNEPFPINTTIFGAWSSVESSHLEFLHIKKNGTMEADYFREKYEFWLNLPIFSGSR